MIGRNPHRTTSEQAKAEANVQMILCIVLIRLKFPNGLVLIEANTTQSEDKISVQASFSNEDNKYLYIRIDQFNQQEDIDFQTFEIEGDSVVAYSSHGKEFFIS